MPQIASGAKVQVAAAPRGAGWRLRLVSGTHAAYSWTIGQRIMSGTIRDQAREEFVRGGEAQDCDNLGPGVLDLSQI